MGDQVSILESGRSPGEGNSHPLQYACLENPMDGGTWWATVHGVPKSWTQLSDFTFLSCYYLPILSFSTSKNLRYTFSCSKIYPPLVYFNLDKLGHDTATVRQNISIIQALPNTPSIPSNHYILYTEGIVSDVSSGTVPTAGYTRSLSLLFSSRLQWSEY